MRKYVLAALLATSVAMPAMAQDESNEGRRDRGAARAERAMERAENSERSERVERQRQSVAERANWSERGEARQRAVESQAREPAFQQPALRQQGERRAWEQRRRERSDAIEPQVASPVIGGDATVAGEGYRSIRVRDGSTDRRYRDRTRTGTYSGDRSGTYSCDRSGTYSGDRSGTYGGVRSGTYSGDWAGSRHAGSTSRWSNHWRTDRRYDWRRHRDSHRSLYRLGGYRDPYGSRYRRFTIGFSLFPSYYQSNYWLDDPFMYRLPRAYGPYRWVRYNGDALLVNIYSGQVVDVVHGVFW
jgi:Ni/Co efflux regulator RcnB